MASGTFDQNSLNWQIQQIAQQMGEWFERWLTGVDPSNSNDDSSQLPAWLLQGLFWLMVVGVIGWASWQLYQLLYPYITAQWQRQATQTQLVDSSIRQTAADWLRQSRAAKQQGNYPEACRALYMATLQQLNDRGLIVQELSRTDGEYLSLVQNLELPRTYQVLIHIHERLCFDRVTISSETYERCWQAYQEIERS